MKMTHSEKSHIRRMKAWPCRQEVQTVYGQSVLQRDLRWTQDENKNKGHRHFLCRIQIITESSDSEQHHGQNTKTTGSPEARGGSQETRRNKGTREEDGRIPQYSSRSCCWSQILFFRTRSIRNSKYFLLVENPSLTS